MVRWLILMAMAAVAIADEPALEPFTVADIVTPPLRFTQRGFNGTWISDFEFTYTISGEPGIFRFNVDTLESDFLVDGETMANLDTTSPILSADRNYILAPSDVQPVYRYSRLGRFALYEIGTDFGDRLLIADHELLQLCIFGAGHDLAYVLNNNLYYLPGGSAEGIPITRNGINGVIYNGHTDWVYEEDVMYSGQATWFNPDGTYLAFASFDDTLVDTYSYYYFGDNSNNDEPYLYPELVDLKYPKVGKTNPTVRLRVVHLAGLVAGSVTEDNYIELQAPVEHVTNDHILGGVTWATANEVVAHWMNRRQNVSVLSICNILTGDCENEIRTQSNGWVPLTLPRFSADGSFFMSLRWSLEQANGYVNQHLYQTIRRNGEFRSSSVTPGDFTVNNYVGMNEANIAYFVTRTVTGSPWRTQVHRLGANAACLSCNLKLPEGGDCTWATATVSPGGRYMSITCSSSNEPSATFLINPLTGELITTWEDNASVRQALLTKQRPQSIITTVPLQNGHPASVRLHLPPNLDLNGTKTYPMVFYVYSGPNTNTVFDTFTVGYHSVLATNHDTIYLLADGRGAGLNGQANLYALNNALGTVEIEDHFVILRQVLDRYSFIDRSRVAIWGHSYGGYATLLTLLHDDDHLFQCGVSGAPVTSWLYYNTMYTERYMGVPTEEDNLAGYQRGDVTLLAEKLRGHDFFVMHGNADDNVHYQNAALLYKALADLNIPFEQMSYPDEAHSLTGVNLHRYNTMNRYWQKCIGMPEGHVK